MTVAKPAVLISCGILVNLGLVTDAMADGVRLYYENRPPFMIRQGDELSGSEGGPAIAAFRAAKVDFELVEAPVSRQVALVGNNDAPACAIGLYRTAEREKLGKYTLPLFLSLPQQLVMRSDNNRLRAIDSLATLLADSGIKLVLRNGYSYGSAMDALLAKANSQVLRPPEDSRGRMRMVLLGMADASLFTADEANYLIGQLGDEGKSLQIKLFPDTPAGQPRHLFCSKQVDDGIIRRLDQVLNARQ